MKQIMGNLSLALFKVEYELKKNNVRQTKTLINTYRNLLQRFMNLTSNDPILVEYKQELLNHKKKLSELHDFVGTAISNNLKNNEYRDADSLAIVLDKLYYSIKSIEQLYK